MTQTPAKPPRGARKPYAKPRAERVPIQLDQVLLACECKNTPHVCFTTPGQRPRS
jgi:hypothetical protein